MLTRESGCQRTARRNSTIPSTCGQHASLAQRERPSIRSRPSPPASLLHGRPKEVKMHGSRLACDLSHMALCATSLLVLHGPTLRPYILTGGRCEWCGALRVISELCHACTCQLPACMLHSLTSPRSCTLLHAGPRWSLRPPVLRG
jgi:hypothetical protein